MTPHLEPADIFLTKGDGLFSRLIRFFTRHVGESRTEVNHVGVVVQGGPIEEAVVVEALSRVRRHPLWARYGRRPGTSVAVYRATNVTLKQVQAIVAKAEGYVDRRYGWPMIVAHFLDWLLQGAYVFRRLVESDNYPICSWVVAHAYKAAGLSFDVEPGAASPDDIWDFVIERPDVYAQIRPLNPLVEEESMAETEWRRWTYAVLAGLALVGLPLAGLVPDDIQARWIWTAALIVGFLLVAARLQTGTVLGFLLDSRRKASSSHLQLVGWTVLIVSAFSAAALWNVTVGATDPLGIAIPAEIWAALGISVTSFVGSPIIKNAQTKKGESLQRNDDVKAARIADVITGEQAGDDSLDLGKVQMLLFTVVILVAYAAALLELLSAQAAQSLPIEAFPSVGGGMLALLGLSHSGYLVAKNVPQPGGQRPGGGS